AGERLTRRKPSAQETRRLRHVDRVHEHELRVPPELSRCPAHCRQGRLAEIHTHYDPLDAHRCLEKETSRHAAPPPNRRRRAARTIRPPDSASCRPLLPPRRRG